MTTEIENKVIACLRQIQDLETRSISLHDDIVADLKMDSLDHVEFLMAIEETFVIDVSDAEAESVKTVADAVSLVAAKTS